MPTPALLANFVTGIAFPLPLPSWHEIVSITGTLAVFTFSIGSVSLLAFRRAGVTGPENRLRGMGVIAPAAFVVGALVIYWVGWSDLLKTVPIVAVSLILYAVTWVRQRQGAGEPHGGWWLLAHLAFLYLVSVLGGFDGLDVVAAPWDSVLVAVASFAVYFWGCASATAYMRRSEAVSG